MRILVTKPCIVTEDGHTIRYLKKNQSYDIYDRAAFNLIGEGKALRLSSLPTMQEVVQDMINLNKRNYYGKIYRNENNQRKANDKT